MSKQENSKIWFNINKEGQIFKKLMLNLDDERKREKVILKHFLLFYKKRYGIQLPAKIIARDNPHDFTTCDENPKDELLLEIVSISDSDKGHKKQALQDKFNIFSDQAGIKNDILGWLPADTSNKRLEQVIMDEKHHINIDSPKDFFAANPFSSTKPMLFKLKSKRGKRIILTSGEKIEFEDLVTEAIRSKEDKDYKNINKMVLIVDDKTACYSRKEIKESTVPLIKKYQESPFKEIFIYSGLFSNDSDLSAEFIFSPIKTKNDPNVLEILTN